MKKRKRTSGDEPLISWKCENEDDVGYFKSEVQFPDKATQLEQNYKQQIEQRLSVLEESISLIRSVINI